MRLRILKINSLIVALLLSAGQLVANECSGHVDSCTPKHLCAAATTDSNEQKVWSTDTALSAHVKTALSIGIDCGVIEVVASCDTDPQFCSITELCQQATLVKDNKAIWKTDGNAAGYVALAKDYRLQCEPLNSYLENEVTDPQAKTRYISTGFWVKAPIAPRTDKKLELVISDSTFSDHKISYDPPSLLNFTEIEKSDVSPNKQSNPPRFGQTFELNSLGLVIANPTGALSQEGHFVYLGKPVKTPPKRVKNLSVTSPFLLRMAKIRPRARPTDLVETGERLKLGGLTKAELALRRPRLRPDTFVNRPDTSVIQSLKRVELALRRPRARDQVNNVAITRAITPKVTKSFRGFFRKELWSL